MSDKDFSRYQRQMLLPHFDQDLLAQGCALIIGVGALGSVSAGLLARAGVGRLILVDRDTVAISNLHRQVLYTEQDADDSLPKAEAAKKHLEQVNSAIEIEAIVDDFSGSMAEQLIEGLPREHLVIVDGTDNFETRFLLNDLAVKYSVPLVYGGAVAYQGMQISLLPVSPDRTAPWELAGIQTGCMRCQFGDKPAPGTHDTCDTAGVMGPVSSMVASLQAADALFILMQQWGKVNGLMRQMAFDKGLFRKWQLLSEPDQENTCPCCGQRSFNYLDTSDAAVSVLCGQDAVQISAEASLNLASIEKRLVGIASCQMTPFLLKVTAEGHEMNVFASGRVVVNGTRDMTRAKTLVSQYLGF